MKRKKIKLREYLDIGFFSLEEIMAKKLYSRKMGTSFPVIEPPYLVDTIRKLRRYPKFEKNNKKIYV